VVAIRMVARNLWDDDFEVFVPLKVPVRKQSERTSTVRVNRLLDAGHRFRGDVA
jgi:hypothetical protein